MKSEPDTFGIDDLERERRTSWEGVRNYQARNYLRDTVKRGDLAFLYHSSCPEPGIAGIMTVCRPACPDPTQFERRSPYYDPASRPEAPRWFTVEMRWRRRLRRFIGLAELRACGGLDGLALLQPGNRLSVMPVAAQVWQRILDLE